MTWHLVEMPNVWVRAITAPTVLHAIAEALPSRDFVVTHQSRSCAFLIDMRDGQRFAVIKI